jgi:Dehydratase family
MNWTEEDLAKPHHGRDGGNPCAGPSHDGMVLISGNDKPVPAHLVAIARCGLPAIHLPGGTQLNAPDYVTSNKLWAMGVSARPGTPRRGARLTCRRRSVFHSQVRPG